MNSNKSIQILILLLFILCGTDQSNAQLKLQVDWPEYMEKHKLVWNIFPARWENAPFIGNGLVGSMIHASGDSANVKWQLGRSDVGINNTDGPGRVQIGSINLCTVGKVLLNESYAELDIWNAEASGVIKTTRGKIGWRSYTVLNKPVIIVELFDIQGDEKECRWIKDFNFQGQEKIIEGVNTYQVDEGPVHTIAWLENISPHQRRLYVSLSSSLENRNIWDSSIGRKLPSPEHAVNSLIKVTQKDIQYLEHENRNWWHKFYRKSFISLPKLELESYYWIQLYKMASTSRAEYPMIDNHGVWSIEKAYGYATWDFNVQATYRLHLKSNHVDLGGSLLGFMDRNYNDETMWSEECGELRAGIRQQTFLSFSYLESSSWKKRRGPPDKRGSQPADPAAKFLWACHNYWLHYMYSMDTSLLRRLLPKLEGGINEMASYLEKQEDDKLHIPSGRNWECWVGVDPTGLYGILNWALTTAISIGNELNYDMKKINKWDSLQTNLADYPTGEYPNGKTGFLLGKDQVPVPHRHWTHLLMIFPLHALTWEQKDEQDLIRNSIDYWSYISSGLNGDPPRAGYPTCASICLYASIGQSEKIPDLIDIFLYKRNRRGPSVWASTMYKEAGMVIETPLLFAATLQELLLQSHNGIINVFPAIPETWNDAVFHDYIAAGGFLISAKYKDNKTEFIRITSLAGEKCILQTDMESIKCSILADLDRITKLDDRLYEINLAKGKSILIYNEHSDPDFIIAPVTVQSGEENSFGLNNTFLEKRQYLYEYLYTGQ